jgi:flagellar assembly protein FliH
MNPSPETVRFIQSPRSIRIVASRTADEERGRLEHEREQAAYERGRVEGERALSEQLVRQRAELLELQNGVLHSLSQVLPRLAQDCESALVTLALEAAQKWMAGVPIDAAAVEANVREALEQVEETTDITVQLHPEDLALLQKVNAPLLLPDGNGNRMRFQSANDVGRGGCLVQTRFGLIDARRETKIELTRKALQS